jgi:hypothetical protein
MRSIRNQPGDSFDLLLDTLCNVFGGIILIACLLALIVPVQTSDLEQPLVDVPGHGLLQERRLLAARAELEQLAALVAQSASSQVSDTSAQVRLRDDLQREVDSLRERRVQLALELERLAASRSSDPGKVISDLDERIADLLAQIGASAAETASADARSKAIESRIESLVAQLKAEQEENTMTLRMPRERARTKAPFNVIICFGQIYPVDSSTGRMFPGLAVSGPPTRMETRPLQGRGLDLRSDRAAISSLLREVDRNRQYLALYVYPDSFATFQQFKGLVHSAGIEYGIEPQETGKTMIFTTEGGSSPNPL